jgi:endonuclease/exonuclease/phosphatase family metal-dependent hydrolase
VTTPLTLATYNVRYDTPDDGSRWPDRRERVIATLRDVAPHVVALQEPLEHQLADIDAALPDHEFFGVGRVDGDAEGEFVPVGVDTTRFDVEDWGNFWLSETPNRPGSKSWNAKHPRIATTVDLHDTATDHRFRVLAVHFDHQSERARTEAAAIVSARVRAADRPIVVAGDLNCSPSEDPVEVIQNGGLRDAREHALDPTGPAETFHEFTGDAHERIDYIFLPDDADVLDYRTVAADAPYPSDHWPVVVDVAF